MELVRLCLTGVSPEKLQGKCCYATHFSSCTPTLHSMTGVKSISIYFYRIPSSLVYPAMPSESIMDDSHFPIPRAQESTVQCGLSQL